MKPNEPTTQLDIAGSAWTQHAELGAGIYFLEGKTHLAGHSSPAEHQLLARGAFLIATVRFDREQNEASHPQRPLRTLGAVEAVRRFWQHALS